MDTAVLDMRFLPWRPRKRVMKADTLRDGVRYVDLGHDLGGVIFGLAFALFILIAAPAIVVVLAAGLFTVELPLVALLAVLLLIARFAGIIPWTVLILNSASGDERRESYRTIWRATSRIKEINSDSRVKVRWAWA